MRSLYFYLIAAIVALPALANIQYTCDPSFSTYAPAGICTSADGLNGSAVAGVYSSLFSNANASIYITFGGTNAYGQSDTVFTPVPYSDYYTALATHTDNPVALASLGVLGDPLGSQSDGNVDVSSALASALGLTAPSDNGANTAGLDKNGNPCVLGPGNPTCYNGLINILAVPGQFYFPPATYTTGQIDFYTVVEHETDEVLGTVSCIAGQNTNGCQTDPASTDASAADLFRYSALGTRSFLNAADGSTGAYFSIDSGLTDIADYTNSPNAGDYGDWLSIYPYLVQDAQVSQQVNLDISTDVGVNSNHYPQPEVAVLDAVGFNRATPEPGTMALLGGSLAVLAAIRVRRLASRKTATAEKP